MGGDGAHQWEVMVLIKGGDGAHQWEVMVLVSGW